MPMHAVMTAKRQPSYPTVQCEVRGAKYEEKTLPGFSPSPVWRCLPTSHPALRYAESFVGRRGFARLGRCELEVFHLALSER